MKIRSMAFTGLKSKRSVALYDKWLLLSVLGLLAVGLLMVASASLISAHRLTHQPFFYLFRQVMFLLVGLLAVVSLLRIDTSVFYRISPMLLLLAFVLLILVYIPGLGRTVNGSTRWIHLIFFNAEVSELVKIFFLIFLAGYIQRHQQSLSTNVLAFVKPLLVMGLLSILLLLQPDFGCTVVLVATTMTLLFLAGVRFSWFLFLVICAVVLLVLVSVAQPYRIARLTSFLNPWASQFDTGYQLTQSLIAFGRGGWFGVGLGESIQKLFYLPEAHTDFLFAVLAEELGLLGCFAVIMMFVIIIWRGFAIARKAIAENKIFSAFLSYGLTLSIAFQTVINIGVNTGVLPTKGLTLPFMSYGGSSMVVCCITLGLLMRIDHELRMTDFGLHTQYSHMGEI